jgi:hypothetical protein
MPKGMPIIVRQQKVPNIIESIVAQTPTKSIYAMRVRFVLLDFTIKMSPFACFATFIISQKCDAINKKRKKSDTHHKKMKNFQKKLKKPIDK